MQIWQIVLVIVIVLAIVIGNLVLLRLSAKQRNKKALNNQGFFSFKSSLSQLTSVPLRQ